MQKIFSGASIGFCAEYATTSDNEMSAMSNMLADSGI
jgi:hypothetical protein